MKIKFQLLLWWQHLNHWIYCVKYSNLQSIYWVFKSYYTFYCVQFGSSVLLNTAKGMFNLLENKIDKIWEHRCRDFQNKTLEIEEIIPRINKLGHIKLKSFSTTKKTNNRVKGKSTEWEIIFTSYSSGEGLISITHKEVKQMDTSNLKTQFNFLKRKNKTK